MREDLLVELVGDEFVVYDPVSHHAHALDPEASRVWAALADGLDADALVTASRCGEEQVAGALAKFAELGLLAERDGEPSGLARRSLLARGAKLMAAGVTLPAVVTLALPPTAATAYGNEARATFIGAKPTEADVGYYADYVYSNGHPTNSHGYYAPKPRGGGGGKTSYREYFSPDDMNFNQLAGPGSPVSVSNNVGSFNIQCYYSSKSTPCTTYYPSPSGHETCASYKSPRVCNGSRHVHTNAIGPDLATRGDRRRRLLETLKQRPTARLGTPSEPGGPGAVPAGSDRGSAGGPASAG